jgi:hypothetical protein
VPERGWTITATPAKFLATTGIGEASFNGLKDWAVFTANEWRGVVGRLDGGGREYYSKKGSLTFRSKRTIQRGARSVSKYRASKPGDPPVQDTGRLRNSIIVRLFPPNRVRIVSTHPAAAILEYGSFGVEFTSGDPTVGAALGFLRGVTRVFGAGGGGAGRKTVIFPRPHLSVAVRRTLPFLAPNVEVAIRTRVGRITLTGIRRRIAAVSSLLGFIQAWGIGSKILGPIRGTGLKIARGLGDIQAIDNGTIMDRLIRRGAGRQLGGFIGQMVPPGTNPLLRRQIRVRAGRATGRLLRF